MAEPEGRNHDLVWHSFFHYHLHLRFLSSRGEFNGAVEPSNNAPFSLLSSSNHARLMTPSTTHVYTCGATSSLHWDPKVDLSPDPLE